MPEYTVELDSAEDTTRDEGVLVRVHDALANHPAALGPSVSLDTDRGKIRATFQVEAQQLDEAQGIGLRAFVQALQAAGLSGEGAAAEASD